MIRSALTVGLAQKIAKALEQRISEADSDTSADRDIQQVRRLRRNGQLSEQDYASCLTALLSNAAVSQDMKNSCQIELNDMKRKQLITAEKNVCVPFDWRDIVVPGSAIQRDESNAWQTVEQAAAASLFRKITPIDDALLPSTASTICQITSLPWFDNVDLLRVFDPDWLIRDLVVYYLVFDGSLYRLDGTSLPIHHVNAQAPIILTVDNAADYLRFFCFFVRGEEGPFYTVENMDDPYISNLDLTEVDREAIATHAKTVEFIGEDENGNFRYKSVIYYGNALVMADMVVQSSGMMDMLDDDPLVGDLSKSITAPITYNLNYQS